VTLADVHALFELQPGVARVGRDRRRDGYGNIVDLHKTLSYRLAPVYNHVLIYGRSEEKASMKGGRRAEGERRKAKGEGRGAKGEARGAKRGDLALACRLSLLALLFSLFALRPSPFALPVFGQSPTPDWPAMQAEALQILQGLVRIDTSNP